MGVTPGISPQARKSSPWLQQRRCALLRAYPRESASPKGNSLFLPCNSLSAVTHLRLLCAKHSP